MVGPRASENEFSTKWSIASNSMGESRIWHPFVSKNYWQAGHRWKSCLRELRFAELILCRKFERHVSMLSFLRNKSWILSPNIPYVVCLKLNRQTRDKAQYIVHHMTETKLRLMSLSDRLWSHKHVHGEFSLRGEIFHHRDMSLKLATQNQLSKSSFSQAWFPWVACLSIVFRDERRSDSTFSPRVTHCRPLCKKLGFHWFVVHP